MTNDAFPMTEDPELISELTMELLEELQDAAFDFGRTSETINKAHPKDMDIAEWERSERRFNDCSEKMRFVVMKLISEMYE